LLDRVRPSLYNARRRANLRFAAGAQVAQLVEHVTENHGVGGSIPPLGTIDFNDLVTITNFDNLPCPHCVRITAAGERLTG
jgi:hypothetical protein